MGGRSAIWLVYSSPHGLSVSVRLYKIISYIYIFFFYFEWILEGFGDAASIDESHQITSWSEQSTGVMSFRRVCIPMCFQRGLLQHRALLSLDASTPWGHFRAFCVRYTKGCRWKQHTLTVLKCKDSLLCPWNELVSLRWMCQVRLSACKFEYTLYTL